MVPRFPNLLSLAPFVSLLRLFLFYEKTINLVCSLSIDDAHYYLFFCKKSYDLDSLLESYLSTSLLVLTTLLFEINELWLIKGAIFSS